MEKAFRVASLQGFFKEEINAIDIKSRPDARKVGPFVDQTKEWVSWVGWGEKLTGRRIRPYFRHCGACKTHVDIRELVNQKKRIYSESATHRKAKKTIIEYLKKLIAAGEKLPWAYRDPRVSDFSLTGDLLSEVVDVREEHPYETNFLNDMKFEFDIALIGKSIKNEPVILGAIELELTHEFELQKCLICKSSGFPLISIDITDVAEQEITEDWCKKRLVETRTNSSDGRRRNYIYLHYMLYPVFMDIPENILKTEKHAFVIFVKKPDYNELLEVLMSLQRDLALSNDQVLIQQVNLNPKDKGSISTFENEGSIAGPNWTDYNENKFIRLTIKKPIDKCGALYKYHLMLASLLNARFDTLVGYKYKTGQRNDAAEDTIWKVHKRGEFLADKKIWAWQEYRLMPKRLTEPVKFILDFLDSKSNLARCSSCSSI